MMMKYQAINEKPNYKGHLLFLLHQMNSMELHDYLEMKQKWDEVDCSRCVNYHEITDPELHIQCVNNDWKHYQEGKLI